MHALPRAKCVSKLWQQLSRLACGADSEIAQRRYVRRLLLTCAVASQPRTAARRAGRNRGRTAAGLAPGESAFSLADQRLLHDLTRQAGIAVQTVWLTTDLPQLTVDLQQSRERLVTTRASCLTVESYSHRNVA